MKIALLSRNKLLGVLFGIFLLIAGVVTVVFGIVDSGKAALIMSIAVAVVLFALGILYIASGCLRKLTTFFAEEFIYGSLFIAFGVLFVTNTGMVPTILVYTIAITLIALGAVYLIRFIFYLRACNGKKNKKDKMMVRYAVFACILAVLLIAGGVLALIFQGTIKLLIYIATGVILGILGVSQIVESSKR